MATILCVWELGTDLGHLSTLRLPVELALSQGHTVVMALRESHNVQRVFGDWPIRYLQAPFRGNPAQTNVTPIPSFTHLLIRQCFESVVELVGYLNAWQQLYDEVKPDLVLFEHSPTALIAAYGCPFKKIVIGNGFTAPPGQQTPGSPFVPFPTTSELPAVWQGLMQDDVEVLKLINTARSKLNLSHLPNMHTIFVQAEHCFLMTWPMLDPFGPRNGATYLGIEPPRPATPPIWPHADGPKIFGYLHAFPALVPLLQNLQSCNARAVLFIRNLPPNVRDAFEGSCLSFVDQPVDLNSVAREADWVINHGNHSTAAYFVSQGVPQLFIPLHQEHLFLARNVVRQGAAVLGYQDQADFAELVKELCTSESYRKNALMVSQSCDQIHADALRHHIARVIQLFTNAPM